MYEKVRKINRRLKNILQLLDDGNYSAKSLSNELHVSVPTVSRAIKALKQEGYEITSVRDKNGWHYKLISYDGQLAMGFSGEN